MSASLGGPSEPGLRGRPRFYGYFQDVPEGQGTDRKTSRLWPPAAATSSARFADGWPRTSARSPAASDDASSSPAASTVVGTSAVSPRRWATASATVATPNTGGPPASAASAAFASGTSSARRPARRAAAATGSTPRTPCTRPSSPTSPRTHQDERSGSGGFASAARSPSAIGRSYAGPSLRTPAGARFTVTRR